MTNLVFHPRSQKQLERVLANQPQVVLLSGQSGVGLRSAAWYIAHKTTHKNSIITLKPDEKNTIKIERIRELYDHTRTKTKQTLVIIVNQAETMHVGAQNAFLKLLEDTPTHVQFILTSHYPQLLLPTITSRSQQTRLLPLNDQQTAAFLDKLKITDKTKRTQLVFLANGLPAELCRLTDDSDYFAKRSSDIRRARGFIHAKTYEKLVAVYKLGTERETALQLLRDMAYIVSQSIAVKPDTQLTQMLQRVLKTEDKLLSDGHVRSQLLLLAM